MKRLTRRDVYLLVGILAVILYEFGVASWRQVVVSLLLCILGGSAR